MANYRLTAYTIEILAAVSILITLLLPWHEEQGRGWEVLLLALNTLIPIGHPFDPEYIPVSQWWLVWIIPLVCAVLLMRAIIGGMYKNVELGHSRMILLFIMLGTVASFSWYGFSFTEDLQPGYFLAAVGGILLALTLIIETLLPDKTAYEKYIDTLPPDDPERIMAGAYKICPYCTAFNTPEARVCHECGIRLFADEF